MKIKYQHYRVPILAYKFSKRKGEPSVLARYMRGHTRWKPSENGGKTICTIVDDTGKVIAIGETICVLEDHFCYKTGRGYARNNAYRNMMDELVQTVTGCVDKVEKYVQSVDEYVKSVGKYVQRVQELAVTKPR